MRSDWSKGLVIWYRREISTKNFQFLNNFNLAIYNMFLLLCGRFVVEAHTSYTYAMIYREMGKMRLPHTWSMKKLSQPTALKSSSTSSTWSNRAFIPPYYVITKKNGFRYIKVIAWTHILPKKIMKMFRWILRVIHHVFFFTQKLDHVFEI